MSRLPVKKYKRLVERIGNHLLKARKLEEEVVALLESLNQGEASQEAWNKGVFASTWDEDGSDNPVLLRDSLCEQMEVIRENVRGEA